MIITDTLKVAIIAGEPSGDLLASGLMANLIKNSKKPIQFFGIGGAKMAEYGLKSVCDMSILSVGGYGFEVIRSIPYILYIRQKIIKQIIKFKPDVFIGVDAPDFNFYVEKKLHQSGIKTVHYISPTIWAWRYERIYSIKKTTDLMLCIFPMEEAIYKKENINARFVGHQLANNTPLDIDTLKYKEQLGLKGIIFTILVGSRGSEIKSLGKIFIKTCNIIHRQVPNATFLFPFVNDKTKNLFVRELSNEDIKFKYQVFVDQTSHAIRASDMVMAKSGTVTLEVALCKKPLIVSYKVSKFTEWLVRRKIKIKYASQPNILLNEEIAPELLQDKANPENLAIHFMALYKDLARQARMAAKFRALHLELSKQDDTTGALAVLELINNEI
ncbi:MAG: lipid-A-disaccharide synthase [Burkholderiales bacterium]|jgi:lipid-A-disaccharide synthase|nr:lipid-A-disaccharide synthase [Burkholderiales bacterium]